MKNKLLIIIVSFLVITAGIDVHAQQKDTAARAIAATIASDSLKYITKVIFVTDTTKNKVLKTISLPLKHVSREGHIVKDTIYLQSATLPALDTSRFYIVYSKSDSLYERMIPIKLAYDTSRKKIFRLSMVPDTALKAKKSKAAANVRIAKGLYVKYDSLYKQQARLKYSADTAYAKKYKLYLTADSFFRNKSFPAYRADSLQHKVYSLRLQSDSSRIKKYLDIKEHRQILLLKKVTALGSGFRTKKLLLSVPCVESDTLFIKNIYRKVRVTTSSKSAVSITTTYYYKDSLVMNDEALLKKMGITVDRKGKNVTVMVNGLSPQQLTHDDPLKPALNNPANSNQYVSIEVPANITVVINTSNTETKLDSYVKNLKTQVMNGTLTMISAGHATLKADYCTITAGDIQKAEMYMFSSRLSAAKITDATLTSGASEIDLDECKSLELKKSSGDEIRLKKAGSVRGNKNFGTLSLTALQDTVALSGYGMAVSIKKFMAGTTRVQINSKYADVKLPLSGLKDYAVYYEGSFKDVNKTVTATKKLGSIDKVQASFAVVTDSLNKNIYNQNSFKTILKANAGNMTAGHAKIDIVCPYCNVVFN
ncbi:MAG: hypothetical protein U0V75_05160 [Ferruginibacter sp.]